MAQHGAPAASADIDINATPDTVYGLITDLPTLAELAEETASMRWRKGDSVQPGAVFRGANRNGIRTWTTACTVTDAMPGRVFGFDVRYAMVPIAHWRYEISEAGGGCHVTESTWDRRPGWFRAVAGYATGVHDRASANADHIKVTLQRLKQRAEKH